ncbi:MAG: hypothetical protein NZM09_08710 [Ignavibacterium sp.]|nr:hypothetical protein [Ignavibacterium sp.]MDW8375764.1 hypothetical protein [Ignavibacteriales bacterium]
MNNELKKEVDALIEQFWKRGYLTVSRKFGTYLPEPSKIGGYDVDVIAKYKNNYAIGIVLRDNDFSNISKLKEKIIYLASRQTKYSHKNVSLYIGVSSINFIKTKQIISELPENLRKNILVIQLFEEPKINTRKREPKTGFLFS